MIEGNLWGIMRPDFEGSRGWHQGHMGKSNVAGNIDGSMVENLILSGGGGLMHPLPLIRVLKPPHDYEYAWGLRRSVR